MTYLWSSDFLGSVYSFSKNGKEDHLKIESLFARLFNIGYRVGDSKHWEYIAYSDWAPRQVCGYAAPYTYCNAHSFYAFTTLILWTKCSLSGHYKPFWYHCKENQGYSLKNKSNFSKKKSHQSDINASFSCQPSFAVNIYDPDLCYGDATPVLDVVTVWPIKRPKAWNPEWRPDKDGSVGDLTDCSRHSAGGHQLYGQVCHNLPICCAY